MFLGGCQNPEKAKRWKSLVKTFWDEVVKLSSTLFIWICKATFWKTQSAGSVNQSSFSRRLNFAFLISWERKLHMKREATYTRSEVSTLLYWHNWFDKVWQWYYHGTTGLLPYCAHYLKRSYSVLTTKQQVAFCGNTINNPCHLCIYTFCRNRYRANLKTNLKVL